MRGEEILLVEDSPEDVLLTTRALRKNGIGNDVVVAQDGAEALERLLGSQECSAGGPKLVLLDLRLPRVDGLEVLRRLRADERTRSLTVVAFTPSGREQDVIHDHVVQLADLCIQKGVDFTEFTRAVGRLRPLL